MAARGYVQALLVTSTIAMCLASSSAAAQGSTLVVIDPDPAFERAVRVALEPWGVEIRSLEHATPGATMPGSSTVARDLASEHDAGAIAWVSQTSDGYALWLYDSEDDRTVARPMESGPPFDEARAASLALTLKTLLRHSHVAPPAERFGKANDDFVPVLRLGLSFGVRAFELAPGHAEPRLGLFAAWFPEAWHGYVGLGIDASLGTGVSADKSVLSARFASASTALGVWGHLPLAGRFDILGAANLGGRLTWLNGALVDPTDDVSVVRINPFVGAWVSPGFTVGQTPLRLGVRLGVDVPLRKQRYRADGVTVLTLSPVALDLGLTAEVAFD